MRILLIILVLTVTVMAFSGVALAATPQDIYNDYADNGKLDGTYTDAELKAYLNDATLEQYADTATKSELDTLVTSMLNKIERVPLHGHGNGNAVAGGGSPRWRRRCSPKGDPIA